jgi:hypothetical protein
MRQDSGVIHIMAAGIDTIAVSSVPWVQPLGVALHLSFSPTEKPGKPHTLTVSTTGPDGYVLDSSAEFATPARLQGMPEDWRTALGIALPALVPLRSYGTYSRELDIDGGAITSSIGLRVAPDGSGAVGGVRQERSGHTPLPGVAIAAGHRGRGVCTRALSIACRQAWRRCPGDKDGRHSDRGHKWLRWRAESV